MTFKDLPITHSERRRTHHLARMAPNEAEPFRVLLRKLVDAKGGTAPAATLVGVSESSVKRIANNHAGTGVVTAPVGAKILAAWKRHKEERR